LILFEGGLTTKWGDLRPILGPAVVLSTLGVVVTSAVVAAGAWLLFDLSASKAFLLGAVVGPTDAAAVFGHAPANKASTSAGLVVDRRVGRERSHGGCTDNRADRVGRARRLRHR